jgi:hypothetical protein
LAVLVITAGMLLGDDTGCPPCGRTVALGMPAQPGSIGRVAKPHVRIPRRSAPRRRDTDRLSSRRLRSITIRRGIAAHTQIDTSADRFTLGWAAPAWVTPVTSNR